MGMCGVGDALVGAGTPFAIAAAEFVNVSEVYVNSVQVRSLRYVERLHIG